jgi:hypothetical protein
MKRWLLSLVAVPLVANAAPPLNCDVGPVTRYLAGCADPFAEEFTNARAVVLVRVIASTYPSQALSTYPSEASKRDYLLALGRSTAKLKVLRSWKGPYSAGASVAVATQQQLCAGQCAPYPFQVGEKVVVFIADSAEPISVAPSSVINAAHVKDAIPVLDALAAKTGT